MEEPLTFHNAAGYIRAEDEMSEVSPSNFQESHGQGKVDPSERNEARKDTMVEPLTIDKPAVHILTGLDPTNEKNEDSSSKLKESHCQENVDRCDNNEKINKMSSSDVKENHCQGKADAFERNKDINVVCSSDFEESQRQGKADIMPETSNATERQLQDKCDNSASRGDTDIPKKKSSWFSRILNPFSSSETKTDKSSETKTDKSSETKTDKKDPQTSPKYLNTSSETKTDKKDLQTSTKDFNKSTETRTEKRDSQKLPKDLNTSSETKTENRDSTPLPKDFNSLQIFQGPMCLISTDAKTGKFEINEKVLDEIKKIDSQLVVVAIAGLYRTGKSYLMNRLAESTSGFQLGNTIESKTKGIWAWCRPHPTKENYVLLLLDTEGLGDIKKGDAGHDNKIFTLAALLCNVLIYNMMSTFNQDAVEKLTFITEMSKNIKFKSKSEMNQDEGDQLALILPTFVLCLRDFHLKLEKDGVKLSTDDYLDDCLGLKQEKEENDRKYNRPRERIRAYFPNRKCFTFDRPGDRDVMEDLDKAHMKDLSKSFVKDSEQFIRYINTCEGKVLLSSKPVKGIMFASLVKSYVLSIQNGGVPDVDDAIMVVSRLENKRVADAAIVNFTQQLQRIELPVLNKHEFDQLFLRIKEASLSGFRLEAMFESGQFETEAARKMEDIWKQTSTENMKLVGNYCSSQVQLIYDNSVRQSMRSGKYKVPGGYAIYKLDIDELKASYKHKTKDIECYEALQALHSFLESEVANERKILQEDQKLTEADRKRELDEMQKVNQETQKEQQRLFDKRINEEKERSEKQFNKMEMDRQAYMKQEEEKMKILVDKWRDQKELKEKQIQMMTTENEKQREELKSEIKKIKDDNLHRDQENQLRFEKLLENEHEKHKQQLDEMKNTLNYLIETEKQKAEKYEKEVEMYRSNLQKTIREKEAEKEKHNTEKFMLEQEKTLAMIKFEQESNEKEKVLKEKQYVISENEQLQRENDSEKRENERLAQERDVLKDEKEQIEQETKQALKNADTETKRKLRVVTKKHREQLQKVKDTATREKDQSQREEETLCQEKDRINQAKEQAERKITRLKERGFFERVFNTDA